MEDTQHKLRNAVQEVRGRRGEGRWGGAGAARSQKNDRPERTRRKKPTARLSRFCPRPSLPAAAAPRCAVVEKQPRRVGAGREAAVRADICPDPKAGAKKDVGRGGAKGKLTLMLCSSA